jgi:hypothetical protein
MRYASQILQFKLEKRVDEQLAGRLNQQGTAQHSGTSSKQSSTAAAAGAGAGRGAEAMQQPHLESPDMVLQYLGDEQLRELLSSLLSWQEQWANCELDLALAMNKHEKFIDSEVKRKRQERNTRLREEKRERRAQRASRASAISTQQRVQQKLLRGQADRSSSDGGISSEDEPPSKSSGAAAGQTYVAAAGAKGSSSSSSKEEDEDSDQPEPCCPVCKAEAAGQTAIQLFKSHTSSSSSSSTSSTSPGSSSQQAAAGLYGALPVPWSDPFMMRRLLWDLLGKLKPTAQAWFREHWFMCPHRLDIVAWHAVVLSLARHIWAPPGAWGFEHEQQMALLLPGAISDAWHVPSSVRDKAAAAERKRYGYALDAGFADQSGNAQAAALLSLQALLALDPHGARVQPRPELLFYTPAGFHAAVCKTLMQAVQVPAPPAATAAAAGAGAGAEAAVGVSQQVGGLQEKTESPLSQMLADDRYPRPHYLQAWSEVVFPAWYMWWHIGLLAYHQQQQQHQSSMQQRRQAKQQQQRQQQLLGRPGSLRNPQEQQQEGAAAGQYLPGRHYPGGSPPLTSGTPGDVSLAEHRAKVSLSASDILRSSISSRRVSTSAGAGCSSADRAGGVGEGSSSSSSSGGGGGGDACVVQPAPLQDLYNDPDARYGIFVWDACLI